MANAQGLGQGVAAQSGGLGGGQGGFTSGMGMGAMPAGQQLSQPGQMGNQFPMQGVGGSPRPMGVNMPQSVQRMPGGFGLSPQMLGLIAQLQRRSPQFAPGQVPPHFGGASGYTPAPNPYAASPGGAYDPFGQGRFGR